MSMKLLENKTALVTGGSRGIGEAIVLKFAENGANVAFTYLSSDEKAQALVEKAQAFGVKVVAYKSDAADFSAAETLVNNVINDFGVIDICINNAGISRDNLLLKVTEDQWDEIMQANLKSVFNLTKHVIKPMLKARKGSIINMSSVVGVMGNAGQSSYAASKAGIIGFTKSIAAEIGSRSIRCNAIAPGFVETEMTHYLQEEGADNSKWFNKIPMKRFCKPEEVADVALFLGSDLSTYVTGQTLNVCGGMCM